MPPRPPHHYRSSAVPSWREYILYSSELAKSILPCSTCLRVAESIGRGSPMDSRNATAGRQRLASGREEEEGEEGASPRRRALTFPPLQVLPPPVPLQLLGHDVDDLGQGLERGLGVEEGEARATGQDVDGRLGVLVPHGVPHLAVDEGVELGDALAARGEALVGGPAQGGDGPGAVAVALGEVLGDLGLDAKVLDDVDEERPAEAVGADEPDLVGLAGAVEDGAVVDQLGAADARGVGDGPGPQPELGDGGVDALLGHLAVGRPLAARARQEARGGDVDEVAADEGLGVLGLGVLDERAEAGPGGEDVAPPDLDVRREVVADLVEDPLDRPLVGQRVRRDGRGLVRGAGDGVALPRQEEDDAPVGRGGVDEAHLGRAVVAGQDHVDARGRGDDGLAAGVVHPADRVSHRGTAEPPVGVPAQARDLHVVDHGGPVQGGRHADGHVHAGVVVGAVVVHEGPDEIGPLQHGERLEGLAPGEEVGALDALAAGKEVVALGPRPVVGGLPPPVDGEHDREPHAEMGRRLQKILALLEGLLHQLVLGVVEVPDGLLEVSHAAVHQLGALAARAAAEVVPLDQGHLQPAGGGVESHAGAGGAPAHDQHVVFVALPAGAVLEGGDLLVARLDLWEARQPERPVGAVDGRRHGGGPEAGDVAGSVHVVHGGTAGG
ncbi:hypothetical protein ColTof3_04635 [Colletotrichum tofieldiae]|nr:hypothetical protein ColTof3_04635 [Colletotrichum tofieldiae]